MMRGRGQHEGGGIASVRTAVTTASRLQRLLLGQLDALPLGVFLLLAAWLGPTSPIEWQPPYVMAALLALAVQGARIRRGDVLDCIHVALAAYFTSGAAGVLLGWDWLNRTYGELEATAMLLWVLPVGLGFMLGSPAGFVGAAGAPPTAVLRMSALLLVVACMAAAWSALHPHDAWLGAVLPFVLLFVAQSLLRAHALRRG